MLVYSINFYLYNKHIIFFCCTYFIYFIDIFVVVRYCHFAYCFNDLATDSYNLNLFSLGVPKRKMAFFLHTRFPLAFTSVDKYMRIDEFLFIS